MGGGGAARQDFVRDGRRAERHRASGDEARGGEGIASDQVRDTRARGIGEAMKQNADRARGLNAAELDKEVKDSAEQMFRLRFQMSMGQMDGLNKVRKLRKEKARMLTVMREREIDQAKSGKPA